MIDSVAFVWGSGSLDASSRRVRRALELTPRQTISGGVVLDIDRLARRLGSGHGELRSVQGARGEHKRYGHWKVGHVDLMYSAAKARLEVRASLPKLLTGRNDVVLSERGVRDALRELVAIASEATETTLDFECAVPTRLDLVYQWLVPSVAEVIANMRAAFQPARKRVTVNVSPNGGRSLVYGYGSKRVIRMYDKVLELADQGEDSSYEPDTLLRFEIQDRRRDHLRLIHERGYRACDVREDFARLLKPLTDGSEKRAGSLEEYVRRNANEGRRLLGVLGALQLAERDELLPIARRHVSQRTFYELRKRARTARLEVMPWLPHIPADAFEERGLAA